MPITDNVSNQLQNPPSPSTHNYHSLPTQTLEFRALVLVFSHFHRIARQSGGAVKIRSGSLTTPPNSRLRFRPRYALTRHHRTLLVTLDVKGQVQFI